MIRLVLRRLAGAALVLAAVAVLGFLALRLAPGGPFESERRVSPEIERNVRAAYRLDRPVAAQLAAYLGGLLHGDLGPSLRRPVSVNEILAEGLPRSAALGLLALGWALAAGLALGALGASRRGELVDRLAMSVAMLGVAVPAFVLGPVLLYWLSLRWGLLPPARWDGPASAILPALTLGLVATAGVARLVRAGLVEALGEDFTRTARAKGAGRGRVLLVHALGASIGPVLAHLAPLAASLITGSFVVERIFQIPGLGQAFVGAVFDRDYPVLAGLMVFYSAVVLLLGLAADVAHALLDPRVREGRR